jgi:hypothetical protein
MRLHFQPKLFLAAVTACVVLGLISSYAFGLSFWWSLAIVTFALLVNGLVAQVEDQAPESTSNSQGESKSQSPGPSSDA